MVVVVVVVVVVAVVAVGVAALLCSEYGFSVATCSPGIFGWLE